MTELASVWPHLSGPQVKVLAQYSLGMHLAEGSGLSRVAHCLGQWLEEKVTAVRQRLRDFYRDAADKSGCRRRELVVEDCFPGLLAWVLRGWDSPELALVLDATTLDQRFVVLAVSVVYRASAIPVAWKILPAGEPGEWQPHWLELLDRLGPSVPAGWRVIVLADRGLYAKWLFEKIVAWGWHPFLRINSQGAQFRAEGEPEGRPVGSLLTAPGQSCTQRGRMFTGAASELACTLTACWSAGCAEPWLVLTDLPTDQAQAAWYGLRGWIERGFKHQKSGGLRWQMTRMTDPRRAQRLWLVMAVALVLALRCGTPAQAPPDPVPPPPVPPVHPPPPAAASKRPRHPRHPDLSVFLIGMLLSRMMLCTGQIPPLPPLRSTPWPTGLPIYADRPTPQPP